MSRELKMKIAHEAPLFLIAESRTFNDYDHAVAPLFENNPDYYDFFVESLKAGREVIIDNDSTDAPLPAVDYVGWIRKLYKESKIETENKLTFILPSIQDDCDNTTRSVKEFLKRFKKIPGRAMVVVQGATFIDLFKSYHDLYPYGDKIGIPFNSAAYEAFFEIVKHPLPLLEKWTQGREVFIEELFHAGWITTEKLLHLIDVAYPDELGYYVHHHSELGVFIESANTPDPIAQGLMGAIYSSPQGLREKQDFNLLNILQTKEEDPRGRLVRGNIKMFRSINHLQTKLAPQGAVVRSALDNILIPADGRRR